MERSTILGQVPVLVCRTQELRAAARKGTILFYHGLGASKETHLPEVEHLATAGFLVVTVDAVGHGQRADPQLEELIAHRNPNHRKSFQNFVHGSAMELPRMLDELISRQWIYQDRIGISGISMGGYISFLGITLEPRFKVASIILGSPEWMPPSSTSPHLRIDRFAMIRLLSQNAGKDEIVDARQVQRFHQRLRKTYNDYDQRFCHIEYPHSGHFMDQTDWDCCIDRSVKWFDLQMLQQ